MEPFPCTRRVVVATLAALLLGGAFAQAEAVKPVVPDLARPLPLSAVRLTGGPLKHAQELDADYLLKLEPDRMLYHLRKRAGLEPRAKEGYGGWDGDGRQLTGHIAGHYLSAVSIMYAATGDPRFKERADHMVKELKEIQDKQGDGYIGGLLGNLRPPQRGGGREQEELADGKVLFQKLGEGVINSGGFDLNGMWSPWYVEHKIFAGLRDAYRFTGNKTALKVEVKFGEWVDGILSRLNHAQIQKMLATEFGGMNEMMVDLYADTGDARWLKAADYFQHDAIIDPLARHEDILAGKHGNTQIPKLYGSLDRYIYTGGARDGFAAGFFWDRVASHHSFVTGGNGRNEYFGQPDKFEEMIDGRTAESCNVYNMLKMTRRLFALWPDGHYADFHERALFNHVLASIDPETGSTCYMVCVGQQPGQREYSDMFGSFTCCVGSGMESHALHGDGLYYEDGGKFWVNIYAPSTADWKAQGVKLEMVTDMPDGESATLKVTAKTPRNFTLALRRPYWVGDGFSVKVNGEAVPGEPEPRDGGRRPGRGGYSGARPVSTYVEVSRAWKTGDTVEIALPRTLRLEAIPDNPRREAILWGPLVLAGDLGEQRQGRRRGPDNSGRPAVPAFLTADKPVADWLKPVEGRPATFQTVPGSTSDGDITFEPFYKLHHRAYGVYWSFFTPGEWEKRAAEYAAAAERQRKLEAATVAFAQPGEMQQERDFNFQGEDSTPARYMERPARRGSKWFSFDIPVDASRPMTLVVTYNTDEFAARSFEILVDGTKVGEQELTRKSPEQVARFFDVEYKIPANLVQGKQKVAVRFQATKGNEIGSVYGLRMIRADAER